MQNKSTLSLAVVVLVLVISNVVAGWSMVIDHLHEATWSEHAKFHAVLSGLDRLAIAILIPFVAWTAFAGRGQLGRITVSLACLVAPASFLAAAAFRPEGSPAWVHLAIAAGVAGAGVAVVWTM